MSNFPCTLYRQYFGPKRMVKEIVYINFLFCTLQIKIVKTRFEMQCNITYSSFLHEWRSLRLKSTSASNVSIDMIVTVVTVRLKVEWQCIEQIQKWACLSWFCSELAKYRAPCGRLSLWAQTMYYCYAAKFSAYRITFVQTSQRYLGKNADNHDDHWWQ